MTREERELAIMYLEGIKEEYVEGEGYERHPLPEYYAIETAIKALEQEPCEDAVSRQGVLKLIKERCNPYGMPTIDFEEGEKLLKYIDNLSSVNPQAKTGHWIEDENEMEVRCSECDEESDECSKYCPNCGCRMVEPQESEKV